MKLLALIAGVGLLITETTPCFLLGGLGGLLGGRGSAPASPPIVITSSKSKSKKKSSPVFVPIPMPHGGGYGPFGSPNGGGATYAGGYGGAYGGGSFEAYGGGAAQGQPGKCS